MNGIKSEFLLTLCIPTYNRGLLLDFVLEKLMLGIQYYPVEVVVCDNASTDKTQDVVKKYTNKNNFKYIRQCCNIGFDKNLISAIENANGVYCWLLGDSALIDFSKIDCILDKLSSMSLDAYIMNISQRVHYIDMDKEYSDMNEFIAELGWHCTQMPALIFKRTLLENISYNRYIDSGFVHFGILFESLIMSKEPRVYFDSTNTLGKIPIQFKNNSWYPQKAWEIFMKNWTELVFSLPAAYNLKNKLVCIKKHNEYSGIFSIKSIIFQRINNAYSLSYYKYYSPYIKYMNNGHFYKLLICIITVLPISFLKILYTIYAYIYEK